MQYYYIMKYMYFMQYLIHNLKLMSQGDPNKPAVRLVLDAMYEDVRNYSAERLPEIIGEKNRHVQCVAEALLKLSRSGDAKAFVLDKKFLAEFDMQDEFGINPSPLFNLNHVASESKEFVADVNLECEDGADDICVQTDMLLVDISEIRKKLLLGKNTEAKLAYVRNLSDASFTRLVNDDDSRRHYLDSQLREVQESTHELLQRQKQRLKEGSKVELVDKMIKRIDTHIFRYKLYTLIMTHPEFFQSIPLACQIYADEITQCLSEHNRENELKENELIHKKNRGIEVVYTPRTKRFFTLGDLYRDCTAMEDKKQIELNMTNIHWTVYAWMLDPYYRVLEAHVDGDSVIKGHITPLIIQGKRTLALDAIEAVPKIRDVIKDRPNHYMSQELFDRRYDILEALFETTKHIGEDMGVDQVLVEKFSGTSWIRDALNALPPSFYHVSEIEKPFGTEVISKIASEILGIEGIHAMEEIQFVNLHLADQGLRYGYKEAGILSGESQGFGGVISGP